MSSESVGANEFPDIAGVKAAHSDNPLLATFRPYIPANAHVRELTALPLIIGTLLGMVFGASSLWLVLKVGLTVSASIPVAVISIIAVSPAWESGCTRRHHPGKQHRADGRLGRGVDCFRCRRDDARDHDSGIRPGVHTRHARCGDGWTAGHPDDDSAAACAHRRNSTDF